MLSRFKIKYFLSIGKTFPNVTTCNFSQKNDKNHPIKLFFQKTILYNQSEVDIFQDKLRYCREELKYPITSLFNTVLRTYRFPMCWKVGEIVPVQKTQTCKSLNDYRPIVLTSVLAKCFEKLVRQILNLETSHHLDDNQFAYKENSGTEDAICTLIHTILQHADKNSNHYARCLFLDFSSAFNKIADNKFRKKGQLRSNGN